MILDAIAELGFPLFVKPARGGSSIGTSKAASEAALVAAIEAARGYDPKVIVEKAIEGREIECAVLEGLDGGPEMWEASGLAPSQLLDRMISTALRRRPGSR